MALRTANIIGSGPNGLAAAITLAQRGVAVTVYERNERIGGACSTAEITLPGFRHDLGSSVYPLGIASPFFRSLPLQEFGLRWIQPDAPVAHPLDDGTAVVQERDIAAMADQLGSRDAKVWQSIFAPLVRNWSKLVSDFTQPLLRFPSHPIAMAEFGIPALMPAKALANMLFRDERTKALFAGMAAHSVLPLSRVASAATGMVLAAAGHTTGWPIAAGGAQSISDALAGCLRSLGGKILTGVDVESMRELDEADATLFDTSVNSLVRLAGNALSLAFTKRLQHFRAGPGIFKVDYALSQTIPWRDAACLRAATVHLGGTLDEIAQSEHDAFYGKLSDKPYVLLVQPSLFDSSRAPEGKHTAWAYCHVPAGSSADRTDVIEAQIERFAPGFRDCVFAQRASNADDLAQWNMNLRGGDVSGGAMTLSQLIARPTLRQYRTNNPKLYLCSSSTPPGGGVHGMCGHLAALSALEQLDR
jgi:phytoene dehydrogenase-like protein